LNLRKGPSDTKQCSNVFFSNVQLLLNYLPPERAAWDRTVARKRQEYSTFCQELIIDPKSLAGRPPEDLNSSCLTSNPLLPTAAVERSTVAVEDHPLSVSDDSKWRIYFADAEIREQILRDVERTHPDMHFFSGNEPAVVARRAAMQRALFVYAKLNPGISYVQGMNELLAVIFYTLGSDPGVDVAAAEAASFYCLVELLGEFRDNFCKQLDNSEVGIRYVGSFSTWKNVVSILLLSVGFAVAPDWQATILLKSMQSDIVTAFDIIAVFRQ
jgi:TBC1 domain family member 13